MAQPKIRANALYTIKDSVVNGDTDRVLLDEYRTFPVNQKSPTPAEFRPNSLSAYDAYNSTDFPQDTFQGGSSSGLTVIGPNGVFSMQIAVNTNAEEERPTDMYVRVNDDTSTPSEWGPWARIHLGNITYTQTSPTPIGGRPGDIIYVY